MAESKFTPHDLVGFFVSSVILRPLNGNKYITTGKNINSLTKEQEKEFLQNMSGIANSIVEMGKMIEKNEKRSISDEEVSGICKYVFCRAAQVAFLYLTNPKEINSVQFNLAEIYGSYSLPFEGELKTKIDESVVRLNDVIADCVSLSVEKGLVKEGLGSWFAPMLVCCSKLGLAVVLETKIQ